MKYIVVTGGVVSGLGKGITISSIGRVLKASGLRITSIKIDPYLNVDAGTMSPFEHGETFVLDDGGETDLDLGNYERFLDIQLTADHNITSGKVYKQVIEKERKGDYLGKTVQIVPHATDAIQAWLKKVAQISVDGSNQTPDVCLIEVGGTVGDIESMVFLEALRQFQFDVGKENILFVHVSLVPVLGTVGEQKTKPTQHSVKELRAVGLSPDLIICRSTDMLCASTKSKISTFCHVSTERILAVHDVSNLYHVPLILVKQGLHAIVRSHLGLQDRMAQEPDLADWAVMAHAVDSLSGGVDIAVVGKYIGLSDSYLSVIKALKHSGILLGLEVNIHWVEAAELESEFKDSDPSAHNAAWDVIKRCKGVLVPGGFGSRGVEGKIIAARYAREAKMPFLGVCLGMQAMVIEFARSVLGLEDANSAEFDERTPHPVVINMPEASTTHLGGTMRLGARNTTIRHSVPLSIGGEESGLSFAAEMYGFNGIDDKDVAEWVVSERHRHRYEVNPAKIALFEAKGLLFTGRDDKGERMETAELPRADHPFYFGTQYHPELKSRPNRPSPPFFAFVAVCAGRAAEVGKAGALWKEHVASVTQDRTSSSADKKRSVESDAIPLNDGRASKAAKSEAALRSPVTSPKHAAIRTSEMIIPKPLAFD